MRRKKPIYLDCFHCQEEIVAESSKIISIVNWNTLSSGRAVVSSVKSDADHFSKLDFHLDCFTKMAGKRFLTATQDPNRKAKMKQQATEMQRAVNYAKAQSERTEIRKQIDKSKEALEQWQKDLLRRKTP